MFAVLLIGLFIGSNWGADTLLDCQGGNMDSCAKIRFIKGE